MWLIALDSSTAMFVTGAMLIVFVLMRRSQKRVTLSKLQPVFPPARAPQEAAGHHLDAPAAMGRWEVEMHELARDLAGQLDTKIAIVQRLVLDAQQAAARLEAAVDRADAVGRRPGHCLSDHDELGLPRGLVEQSAVDPATLARDERSQRVYQLADRGLSTATIASELGSPLGEIELILSVRSSGGG